jgi:hypothetical protein
MTASVVAILQEQAAALYALGMMDYGEMKARLMLTTAALVATGSTICWIHGDAGVAQGLVTRGAYAGHAYPARLAGQSDRSHAPAQH